MPREEFHVRSAIAARQDARQYSGLDLFNRGSGNVASPIFTDIGSGLFSDVVGYLNDRGNRLGAELDSMLETATGLDIVVGITADDKVYIEADAEITFSDEAAEWLGFTYAG